jgi:hypothetical protein
LFQKPYGFFRRNWPDVEFSTVVDRGAKQAPRNSNLAERAALQSITGTSCRTQAYESPQRKPIAASDTGPVNSGCSMAWYRYGPLFPFKIIVDSLILERSGTGAGLQASPFSTTFSVSFRDPH